MVEHPELDWSGRFAYTRAKIEKRNTELYAMDLLWLLTKATMVRFGDIEAPPPSEVERKTYTKDTRTAQEIKDDLLRKLKEK